MNSTWLFKGRVQVIAHRGASAWYPEHTLQAYARAIRDGADFIEPDLVMSRDGVLIARHESEISRTTDVADHPAFAGRRTQKVIDGRKVDGCFSEDFSVDELRTLKAREPLPHLRGCAQDGLHGVPTFDDIIALAARESAALGRAIGVIPEIKHSSHFHSLGLDPEQALLAAWERHAHLQSAPFGIQSFEVGNLGVLREAIGTRSANVFLVQLIGEPDGLPYDQQQRGNFASSYASMITPEGLEDIARYAEVVAPHKQLIVPIAADARNFGAPTALVRDAHAAGLAVHAWTLRPENQFLPPHLRGSDRPGERCESGSIREMRGLIDAGVDALFTDDPALARRAVDQAQMADRDA